MIASRLAAGGAARRLSQSELECGTPLADRACSRVSDRCAPSRAKRSRTTTAPSPRHPVPGHYEVADAEPRVGERLLARARRARRARPRTAGRGPRAGARAAGPRRRAAPRCPRRGSPRARSPARRSPRPEPRRRLVEDQHARLGHQPARDHEHLLLAARERARGLRAAVAEPREERVGAFAAGGDARRSRRIAVGAEREVLVHRQPAKTRRPAGT